MDQKLKQLFDTAPQVFSDYRDRPEQRALAARTGSAFKQGEIALFEAGTGTGKSIAYLAPALIQDQRPVIISTATRQLQEQLEQNDIPLVSRLLLASGLHTEPVKAVTLMGRSNYLSLRRLGRFAQEEPEHPLIERLLTWSESSETGILEEFTGTLDGETAEQIASQSDNCQGTRCATYHQCFYFKRRQLAAQADLVVVNHALLTTDMVLRTLSESAGILPHTGLLVLDEAHRLGDVAVDHFGSAFSARAVHKLLQRMLPSRKSKRRRARKSPLQRLATSTLLLDMLLAKEESHAVIDLAEDLLFAFAELESALSRWESGCSSLLADGAEIRIRPESKVQAQLQQHSALLMEIWGPVLGSIRKMNSLLQPLFAHEDHPLTDTLYDLRSLLARLQSQFRALDEAVWTPSDRSVQMLSRPSGSLAVESLPLRVDRLLSENLWARIDTAILTSATLRTDQGFGTLRNELGLDLSHSLPERVVEGWWTTPFDWHKQARCIIPVDAPEPNDPRFEPYLIQSLSELAQIANGRMFVLMTNAVQMARIAPLLSTALQDKGIAVLKQGDRSRGETLRLFTNSPSVLLGLTSYWEGVDLKGDLLQVVCIPRLPFPAPGEPWTEAYLELLEHSGVNPFEEYSVPKAVLRLRQGIGRLLRSEYDRGIIVILDQRLIQRPYGQRMLAQTPLQPETSDRRDWRQKIDALSDWLRDPG